MSKQILSIWVENRTGVMGKVAGLFSDMEINIDSIAVGDTESEGISRITITLNGDDDMANRIISELHKIVNIVKIKKLSEKDAVIRELAFIMVEASEDKRSNIVTLVEIFRAAIVDIGANTITIAICDEAVKIQALKDLLHSYGIREIVQSGVVAIDRDIKRA